MPFALPTRRIPRPSVSARSRSANSSWGGRLLVSASFGVLLGVILSPPLSGELRLRPLRFVSLPGELHAAPPASRKNDTPQPPPTPGPKRRQASEQRLQAAQAQLQRTIVESERLEVDLRLAHQNRTRLQSDHRLLEAQLAQHRVQIESLSRQSRGNASRLRLRLGRMYHLFKQGGTQILRLAAHDTLARDLLYLRRLQDQDRQLVANQAETLKTLEDGQTYLGEGLERARRPATPTQRRSNPTAIPTETPQTTAKASGKGRRHLPRSPPNPAGTASRASLRRTTAVHRSAVHLRPASHLPTEEGRTAASRTGRAVEGKSAHPQRRLANADPRHRPRRPADRPESPRRGTPREAPRRHRHRTASPGRRRPSRARRTSAPRRCPTPRPVPGDLGSWQGTDEHLRRPERPADRPWGYRPKRTAAGTTSCRGITQRTARLLRAAPRWTTAEPPALDSSQPASHPLAQRPPLQDTHTRPRGRTSTEPPG